MTISWEFGPGQTTSRRIMVDARLHDQFGEHLDDALFDIAKKVELHPGQGCTKRYPAKCEERRGISVYRKPGGKILWLEAFPLYQEDA